MANKIEWIIVHTEASPTITSLPRFGVVNAYHRQLGFPISSLGYFCGYQEFIEKDGIVIVARLPTDEGAHTKGYNSISYGICLAGNGDVELPTLAQTLKLKERLELRLKVTDLTKDKIVAHRHFNPAKTCYGVKLSDNWARNLVSDIPVTPPLTLEQQKISILQKLLVLYQQLLALLRNQKVGARDYDHLE